MKFRFCYVIDATNERIPYTKLKKGGDGKLGWKRNVDRVIFLYDTGIDNFLPFEEDERNFVFTRRRRMNWLSVSRSRGPLLFFLLFYVFYYRNCCCIEDLCCCCCISCSSHQKEDNFFIFFFFVLQLKANRSGGRNFPYFSYVHLLHFFRRRKRAVVE